ncbi:D-alanine--D-alanine ligase [Candidatus Palauibacter soopunensis]|uniref:D-alanine--D-alanine ligase n=1 Tax=Candidatus Palauibacter soopunensis TaxID=3056739 RepID=UPI00239AA7C0|nr:D-alanine--D-alanine ligase [Candidatus Palauibacter soopunensis]MDE2879494.1 D-alanine--D-alanine ligase [Candidatus Palauibacter soopunensis]
MADPRPRVGVLFGGESPEHEVSLRSAKNVIEAIDRERYDIVLIGIDRRGRWHLADESRFLRHASDPRRIRLPDAPVRLALTPGRRPRIVPVAPTGSEDPGEGRPEPAELPALDVVFPVLHGPFGEDGTVQGLLRLAHLPFVGPGILGSAVCMDKDVAKRLLRDAGIPVAPFITVLSRAEAPAWDEAVAALDAPIFVKPANMGSSVGVSKVETDADYRRALDEAFSFDTKVLLERTILGREIEISVLGNETPEASIPGEIAPTHAFYSYEAKYLDHDGADLLIPADLDAETTARARDIAVRAFRTLCCEGMARVDLFLATRACGALPAGSLVVNEINTLPGFTRISMYPKLWDATGVSYPELINRLIGLAIERAERDERLASAIDLQGDG